MPIYLRKSYAFPQFAKGIRGYAAALYRIRNGGIAARQFPGLTGKA